MGRLGFNIVRQKEAGPKQPDPESGSAPDGQQQQQQHDEQNQSNESLEIGELIAALDERNRTISNLRLLSVTLTAVVVCLLGYIFLTQSKALQSDEAAAVPITSDGEYSNQIEALQRDCDAVLSALSDEQSRNCTAQRESDAASCDTRYQQLRAEYELVSSQLETEQGLRADLVSERDDLERKLDAANGRLDATALVHQQQQQEQVVAETTSTSRPTTVGLFDTDRLKKINDLVKDIESGAAIFDLRTFMKKTNDAFSI